MAKSDDRLFAPFPIEMDEHPKIIGLSDAAFRAVFEATFYSRRMLSDGFLDERVVLRRWGHEVAEELSLNDPERPSWVRVESPKPGWRIHDFEKHHPLRADIEAKRADLSEKRSQAGRNGAAKRWQKNGKPLASDSSETETETETETKDASHPQGAKKRETRLPVDWTPTKAHFERAQERGINIVAEAEAFRLHAATHDRHAANWNAAFTTWLNKARPPRRGDPDWALKL